MQQGLPEGGQEQPAPEPELEVFQHAAKLVQRGLDQFEHAALNENAEQGGPQTFQYVNRGRESADHRKDHVSVEP